MAKQKESSVPDIRTVRPVWMSVECVDRRGRLAAVCQEITSAKVNIERCIVKGASSGTKLGFAWFNFKASSPQSSQLRGSIEEILEGGEVKISGHDALHDSRAIVREARRQLSRPPGNSEERLRVHCVNELGMLGALANVFERAKADITFACTKDWSKPGWGPGTASLTFDLRISPAKLKELIPSINAIHGVERAVRVLFTPAPANDKKEVPRSSDPVELSAAGGLAEKGVQADSSPRPKLPAGSPQQLQSGQFGLPSQGLKGETKTPAHFLDDHTYSLDPFRQVAETSGKELAARSEALDVQYAPIEDGDVPDGDLENQNTPTKKHVRGSEAISPRPSGSHNSMPPTRDRRVRIRQALEHDRNFSRVARAMDVSDTTVGRVAKQAGIDPARVPLSREKRKAILDAVKHDHNFSRVAREVGVSSATVNRIAKAARINPGPQGGIKVSEEKRKEVLKALKHLDSFRAVAREVKDISHVTVARIAKQAETVTKTAQAMGEGIKRRHAFLA
jgi:transposase-like protein